MFVFLLISKNAINARTREELICGRERVEFIAKQIAI